MHKICDECGTECAVDLTACPHCQVAFPTSRESGMPDDDDHDSNPVEQAPPRPTRPVEDVELPDENSDDHDG